MPWCKIAKRIERLAMTVVSGFCRIKTLNHNRKSGRDCLTFITSSWQDSLLIAFGRREIINMTRWYFPFDRGVLSSLTNLLHLLMKNPVTQSPSIFNIGKPWLFKMINRGATNRRLPTARDEAEKLIKLWWWLVVSLEFSIYDFIIITKLGILTKIVHSLI